jgi:hypothetical protein
MLGAKLERNVYLRLMAISYQTKRDLPTKLHRYTHINKSSISDSSPSGLASISSTPPDGIVNGVRLPGVPPCPSITAASKSFHLKTFVNGAGVRFPDLKSGTGVLCPVGTVGCKGVVVNESMCKYIPIVIGILKAGELRFRSPS